MVIGKENIRHNMPLHLLLSVVLLLLSPLMIGIANIDRFASARVLEMFVSLIGIILLVPVFLPEQDKNIRELEYAKKTNYIAVYVIRILQALAALALLLLGYMAVMAANHCEMSFGPYFFGTLATMIFMGGLGIFAFAAADHQIIAYLVPMFYYIVAVAKFSQMGIFNPFSMMLGSYKEKIYLAVMGIVLMTAGVVIRYKKR